jgi:hypothetical protein
MSVRHRDGLSIRYRWRNGRRINRHCHDWLGKQGEGSDGEEKLPHV